ncbi:MAG: Kae1-associated serine/threonine protein kinase [Candidatus Heimdallarchaeota archaeon]|nr:Kae1-associated serine/threonine protein kinase [Candidatus Heimdallarchaeota archaeon]
MTLQKHETIALGAESEVFSGKYLDYEVIAKHRFRKEYRAEAIDTMLRKNRSIQEVRLLNSAKQIGVRVPYLLDFDKEEWIIVMQKITGKPMREHMHRDEEFLREKFHIIGQYMGRLHFNNIVHGDLTTSNVIVDDEENIWFIDFGLGFVSTQIEDKAVDILVLKHTLTSSHHSAMAVSLESFLKGYKEENPEMEKIMKRLKKVEDRIRYSH